MLSDDERRRLEQEKNNLEQQHQLLSNKIARISRDLIIETDASVKFKYEQNIKTGEEELESITRRLNEIEKQIQVEIKSVEFNEFQDLPVQVSDQINMPEESMRILHLSDLHFGSSADARRWSSQLVEDLQRNLDVHKLDALILSGDITNRSTPEEYQAAIEFVDELCQDFSLKKEQIIVVPGNHDLNWELSKQAYVLKDTDRCEPHELEQGRCIRVADDAVRVLQQEIYPQRFINFKDFYDHFKPRIKSYSLESARQYSLDIIGNDILVMGLNSAWQIDHHYRDRANININALTNALNEIRRTDLYNNSRVKIAVWHHPINSSHEDRIRDGDFLQRLAVNGFQLFLHGHVHRAENDKFHYDQNTDGRRLARICAGTFGSPTRNLNIATPWQYNLLTFRDSMVRVDTRKRESINGAWEGDYRWRHGNDRSLSYYEIDLQNTRERPVLPIIPPQPTGENPVSPLTTPSQTIRESPVPILTSSPENPVPGTMENQSINDGDTKYQLLRTILVILLGVGVSIFAVKVAKDIVQGFINSSITNNICGGEVGNIQNLSNLRYPLQQGQISSGEKIIFPNEQNSSLVEKGVQAFKKAEESDKNYDSAITLFNIAITKYPNNPEPYIYRNNAWARKKSIAEQRKLYILAAAIPVSSSKQGHRAKEMLRGIADAQTCFYEHEKDLSKCLPNSKQNLVEIKLADDGNLTEVARGVAKKIADLEIVGVIGHYASHITQDAIPFYNNRNNQLPIVSPTSTSSKIQSQVFFRAVSSTDQIGEKLAGYVKNKNIKKVIVFYDSLDPYSDGLTGSLTTSLASKGININPSDKIQLRGDNKKIQTAINEFNKNENFAAIVIPPSALTDQGSEADDKSLQQATNIVEHLSKTDRNLIFGGNSFYTSTILNSNGRKFQNMNIVVPWFAETFSDPTSYAAQAKERWKGQVNWVTAGSYDATQAFMSALSSIDDATDNKLVRANLINKLENVDLPPSYTSGSQLKFKNHEATGDPVLVRVVDGETCSPDKKKGYVFQLIK